MKDQEKPQGATRVDEADAGKEFATRRRVIKGLMSSVPVALTLSNGAAMANTSHTHQCGQEPPTTPPQCTAETPPNDGWVYSADKIAPTDADTPKYCVAYTDSSGKFIGFKYDDGKYIDEHGNETAPTTIPYPLSSACAASFV